MCAAPAAFTETNCTVTRCDPIPGQFVETITVAGTPGQVHAWQYVDDVAILDAAAAPSYEDYCPNGPECEPVLPAGVGVLDAAIAGSAPTCEASPHSARTGGCRASRST